MAAVHMKHFIQRGVLLAAFAAASAVPASAGELKLTMQDGRVTIIADNVPLRTILQEWTRIGKTTIVNADKMTGPAISLQQDVERVPLGRVDQLQRDRRTAHLVGVDDGRLSDSRPFLQDRPQRDVVRDDRHAAVLHRQLEIAGGGRRRERRQAAGQGRYARVPQKGLFHRNSSLRSIRLFRRRGEQPGLT